MLLFSILYNSHLKHKFETITFKCKLFFFKLNLIEYFLRSFDIEIYIVIFSLVKALNNSKHI